MTDGARRVSAPLGSAHQEAQVRTKVLALAGEEGRLAVMLAEADRAVMMLAESGARVAGA